ncbi:hypothetical protein MUG91_G82n65 [Manis pentadactyla]|nr:hypothetical protein MUG91_G82n65 [Manis pentadactyla]
MDWSLNPRECLSPKHERAGDVFRHTLSPTTSPARPPSPFPPSPSFPTSRCSLFYFRGPSAYFGKLWIVTFLYMSYLRKSKRCTLKKKFVSTVESAI